MESPLTPRSALSHLLFLYQFQHGIELLGEAIRARQAQVSALLGIRSQSQRNLQLLDNLSNTVEASEAESTSLHGVEAGLKIGRGVLEQSLRDSAVGQPRDMDLGPPFWRLPLATGQHLSADTLARQIWLISGRPAAQLANAAKALASDLGVMRDLGNSHSMMRARRLIESNRTGKLDVTQSTLLPRAQAGETELPAGITDCRAAYAAGWANQAKLFAVGIPVNHDINQRVWTFRDGSCVHIQAHKPALTYSDDSNLMVVGLTAIATSVASGAYMATRPYDAAWQGYTAHYYLPRQTASPCKTQHFYGWKRGNGVLDPVRHSQSTDPSQFENFAHQPANFTWWKWKSGNAELRRPRAETPDNRWGIDADRLIQSLARFQPLCSATASQSPDTLERRLSEARNLALGGYQDSAVKPLEIGLRCNQIG